MCTHTNLSVSTSRAGSPVHTHDAELALAASRGCCRRRCLRSGWRAAGELALSMLRAGGSVVSRNKSRQLDSVRMSSVQDACRLPDFEPTRRQCAKQSCWSVMPEHNQVRARCAAVERTWSLSAPPQRYCCCAARHLGWELGAWQLFGACSMYVSDSPTTALADRTGACEAFQDCPDMPAAPARQGATRAHPPARDCAQRYGYVGGETSQVPP